MSFLGPILSSVWAYLVLGLIVWKEKVKTILSMTAEPFWKSFSKENALKCDNPEDSSEMKRAENEMMQIA